MKFWRKKMKRNAFTLVELLVVIAIIALLLSVLMPALRLARDQAMIAVCSNNIKQQLIGFMCYAGENNNKVFGDTGWLDGTDRWKYRPIMKCMSLNTEGSIIENWNSAPITQQDIPAPDVFFCPSNRSRSGERRQFWWDFDIGSGGRAPWRIIAYLWILENDPGVAPKPKILGDDNKKWVTRLDVKNSANVELVTDIGYSDRATGQFDVILAGGSGGGGPGMAETSSHVKKSRELFGMNIGFCDGHVEFRPFSQIKQRWSWGSGPNNWW
jgi:prepilin-type N-terminal cleavage/methylation domain-containing protein/prepilin-type processing-associated H-X9-DG protein